MRHRQPASLHENPLFRVHAKSLLVWNVEESCVKDVDALNLSLMPAIAFALRDSSLLVIVVNVGVHIKTCCRDLQKTVTTGMPHSRPQLLVHVSTTGITRGHTHHYNMLASWRRRPRRLFVWHLDDAVSPLEFKLEGLREEETLQSQGFAARAVAVVILVRDKHDKGVGPRRKRHLWALCCARDQPQLAHTRAQEMQQGHAPPAHHGQEGVSLPGLSRRRHVPGLVRSVCEGEAQQEVRAAVQRIAKVLPRVWPQQLRIERVALVLRWQR
mmetsp:Transcript_9076/g.25353  ORF Transcript_9076/g.25353 Transcript_9076/m.25353 type:complete len:270 (+) Transcript_9076:1659-2468(+)